jgi:hypothetical protein
VFVSFTLTPSDSSLCPFLSHAGTRPSNTKWRVPQPNSLALHFRTPARRNAVPRPCMFGVLALEIKIILGHAQARSGAGMGLRKLTAKVGRRGNGISKNWAPIARAIASASSEGTALPSCLCTEPTVPANTIPRGNVWREASSAKARRLLVFGCCVFRGPGGVISGTALRPPRESVATSPAVQPAWCQRAKAFARALARLQGKVG